MTPRAPHVLLALATALVLWLPACGADDPGPAVAAPAAVVVDLWTVRSEAVVLRREWVGQLEPLRTIAVQAPREGRVHSLEVRDGDRVQQGQILARMIGPELEAQRGVLEQRRDQLEDELARWQDLADQGAAGPGEVAAATLRLLELQEQLASVEASAEAYLVRSPASGRVHSTAAGPGGHLTAGQPILQVDDGGAMGVRLTIPATETWFLERTADLSVRDDAGQPLQVLRVVFSSHVQPGLVRAEVYVSEPAPGGLRRGATVAFAREMETILIPWTAVASDEDRQWVALAEPGGDGEPLTLVRRPVELGRAHAEGLEVLTGLEEGDRVLRYEPRSHPEGRPVRPAGPGS